jgi:hypothetical protein
VMMKYAAGHAVMGYKVNTAFKESTSSVARKTENRKHFFDPGLR